MDVLVNPLKRLLTLLEEEKKELTSIYFYATLAGLVQLSVPIGIQTIIGFVFGATMVTSIYLLIVLVVLGVLFVGIFQINQMKIIEKIQQKIFSRYAFAFAERVPRFDLQSSDNQYLPENVNRFFDTLTVQKGLSKLLLDIPTATIQIVFGLALLSLYHPVFILFAFILVTVIFFVLKLSGQKGFSTALKESKYKYSLVAWLEEMARTIRSFKFGLASELNLKKTDKNLVGYLEARTNHFFVLVFQYKSLIFFKVAITAAMLTVGTYLLVTQQLNIGEFIAAEIVILTIISAVEKLIINLENIYDVVVGLEKVHGALESKLEKDGNIEFKKRDKGIAIEFKDLNFQYKDGVTVLRDVNLNIQPGQLVCMMGHESSGKSSLLKLLGGGYCGFTGSIFYDNIPINNYDLDSLRSHLGYYYNQVDLFAGSVLENISFGMKNISNDRIIEVARELGIESVFSVLKDGFETEVDPTGSKLPTSVIRKILLLRAFVINSSLLVLDEPFTGMKPDVRLKIIDTIKKMRGQTTIIVATNDEEFAQQCDKIVKMENGHATVIKGEQ
jgi:ATP-binding cassette, subfamily B, bacterial